MGDEGLSPASVFTARELDSIAVRVAWERYDGGGGGKGLEGESSTFLHADLDLASARGKRAVSPPQKKGAVLPHTPHANR